MSTVRFHNQTTPPNFYWGVGKPIVKAVNATLTSLGSSVSVVLQFLQFHAADVAVHIGGLVCVAIDWVRCEGFLLFLLCRWFTVWFHFLFHIDTLYFFALLVLNFLLKNGTKRTEH